ncbi:quinone-dependent dihydroorotate dehydrogenase [Prochlorococcus marinus]|uniref:Dihydroorotate dehydrogenase (quinone) n=1 Tax=Prochlorococcus marinus XMU1408 TaxID=2213228 RepID=A0A318R689_PROMR|nr:quinone-dependent dihydroorotate dehydrogenase [Prochlorococcus marinus]MBW3041260.1 dihydroorotate dehydrogenase (quinone) [Prochlorococcus marinus str. XMU1408]PYE03849.1 dihydroorotate dehydrogenase (quinone) [Prochlorococcus marinus XMU1408]
MLKNKKTDLYNILLGQLLSQDDGIDAEILSNSALNAIKYASLNRNMPIISNILSRASSDFQRNNTTLNQTIFGSNFKNPLGLAAGFDKNGVGAGLWSYFGFGFAELGTITWHAQQGNPKPRLFRIAKEKAALNRMGFNNEGAEKFLKTIEKQKIDTPGNRPCVLGINLGKSKITPLDEAPKDYALSLELLAPLSDYAVINVSSPNTPGLRSLQGTKQITKLARTLKDISNCPPLLIKIAPDLSNEAIDEIAKVSKDNGIDGIIAINTSLDRFDLKNLKIKTGNTLEQESGGLSGLPLQKRGMEVISRLRRSTNNDLPLIGVGGINSARSAWERIAAGASLIQIYTGWIFEGPTLVPDILDGLTSQMKKHGFRNIKEVIGSKEPWK